MWSEKGVKGVCMRGEGEEKRERKKYKKVKRDKVERPKHIKKDIRGMG
jgi:hypothetical protein